MFSIIWTILLFTFDEHIVFLKEVAKRLKKTQLKHISEKSKFCRKQINYLELVLNEDVWNVDPAKTNSIAKFPIPTTREELKRFLGRCSVHSFFFCDHAALSNMKPMKSPLALMSRWLLRLNAFDFDIKFRKGS